MAIQNNTSFVMYRKKYDYIDLNGRKYGLLTVIERLEEKNSDGYPLYMTKCNCGTIMICEHFSLTHKLVKDCGCRERKRQAIVGQKFGKLTALKCTGLYKHHSELIKCKCDCGNITNVRRDSLLGNYTKSCGCLNHRDLKGQRFGKLTVLEKDIARSANGSVIWKCKCDCGNEIKLSSVYLTNGSKTNCGCLRNINLEGQKFGNLTVLRKTSQRYYGNIVYLCLCDCGTEILAVSTLLRNGKVKSCGCSRGDNLLGQRFGKLTVIEKTHERKSNHIVWKCKCDCGNICNKSSDSLHRSLVISCGCNRFKNDIIGRKFGKLTVLKRIENKTNTKSTIYECKCDCGTIIHASRSHLTMGDVKSCGCLLIKDLTGQKFNMLTAIKPTDRRTKSGNVIWECTCECGNITYASSDILQKLEKKSCGCINDHTRKKEREKNIELHDVRKIAYHSNQREKTND